VALEEEVLGVWPLPAPGDWEAGAPTLGELHARIQQYLQVGGGGGREKGRHLATSQ
jgi:hypothetical protein